VGLTAIIFHGPAVMGALGYGSPQMFVLIVTQLVTEGATVLTLSCQQNSEGLSDRCDALHEPLAAVNLRLLLRVYPR
jgi:hypothetical protein